MTFLQGYPLLQIESFAKTDGAQALLVDSGFVELLKGFLEPLKVGKGGCKWTLPHVNVRQMVYRLLCILPITTCHETGRHILKCSGICRELRFYAAASDETEENRRVVNGLLHRWVMPIIEDGRKNFGNASRDLTRRKVLDCSIWRWQHVGFSVLRCIQAATRACVCNSVGSCKDCNPLGPVLPLHSSIQCLDELSMLIQAVQGTSSPKKKPKTLQTRFRAAAKKLDQINR